jgi:hypothetical protein
VVEDTRDPDSFLKIALFLLALSFCGALLVMPYVAALESKALAAAAARAHIEVWQALTISISQSAVLLTAAVFAGLWAARQLALRTPLLEALFTAKPLPERTLITLLLAFALGIATALLLAALDRWGFANFPSVVAFVHNARAGGVRPSAWQGLLASFYGGLDEEILMRLGLLSLLALAFRTVMRLMGGESTTALPSGVFWAANVVTAVLFGLGHLPATAALAPLTAVLVVRAVVLNGLAGLLFGWLYRRYGLEWAMTSHFGTDLVLHAAMGG